MKPASCAFPSRRAMQALRLLGLFVAGLLLVLLARPLLPAQAAAPAGAPPLQSTPAPADGEPADGAPAAPEEPSPGSRPPPSIVQRILNLLVFNESTLSEALTRALLKLFGGMLYEAIDLLNRVVREVLALVDIAGFDGGPVAADRPMASLEELRFAAWKTLLVIAGVLLPLSLALTVGAAMREGTTSITGYAHAREALLEWVISVALAGASWFLIRLALQLAHHAGQAILSAFSVNLLSDPLLQRELISASISHGDTFLTETPLLLQLFVALFALFLIGSVAISLALALLARYVLLFLITTTAPLMFVLGALRPLRWLSSLWSKAIVLVILLGPINALLLALAMRLQLVALERTGGLVRTIFALLILVGVLSVLISINTMIARGLYGAVIEIAQRAARSTGQVLTLGFALAGAAAALPVLGAGGAGAAGAASAAGSVPPGGPAGGGAAAGGAGPPLRAPARPAAGGHPYDAFRLAGQRSALAGELGSLLQAVNNPVTRGLGMGLRIARAWQRAGALAPGATHGAPEAPSPGSSPPHPLLDQPLDVASGAPGSAAAQAALARALQDEAPLLQRGLAPAQARQKVAHGLQLGARAMAVAQHEFAIPPGRFLQSLGYPLAGPTLEAAGSQFLQSAAGAFAFGDPPGWLHQARPAAGFGQVDAQDVSAALHILANRPTEQALGAPEGIASLARLSFQLRREAVYPTPEAVVASASTYGRGDLLAWMQHAAGQLREPPLGLAETIQRLQNAPPAADAVPGAGYSDPRESSRPGG